MANERKKIGRPPMYNLELAKAICREIATCADSMTKICSRNPSFPKREVIWGWRLDYPEFANMYDNAKRIQADLLVEEINDIADNNDNDTIIKTNKNGEEYEVQNSEWIARSRLRVDTRKWVASKMMPKVYGDGKDDDKDDGKTKELAKAMVDLMKEMAKQNMKDK